MRDDYDLIRRAVQEAVAQSDIVIVNAGSSAGSEDYTVHVLKELGQVLAHGVAIRPGKPVMLGLIDGKPFVGLPGYPVSTWLTADLFVKPLVYRALGQPVPQRETVQASLARRITSPMGVEEYVRVKLGRVGEPAGSHADQPRGHGDHLAGAGRRAAGGPRRPRGHRRGHRGDGGAAAAVQRHPGDGGGHWLHDTSLDLMGSYLRRKGGYYLSSAHVGSQGGLLALRRGEAHMAGVHLLDEATGDYNTSYVHKYLGKPALLVLLARREQGFIVPKGNPKGITSFRDLARPDVRFVNRQRGAGTRLLLDYHLKQEGISPAQVQGYRWELFTHLNVAARREGGRRRRGAGHPLRRAGAGSGLRTRGLGGVRALHSGRTGGAPRCSGGAEPARAIPSSSAAVESLGGYDCSDSGRIRRV